VSPTAPELLQQILELVPLGAREGGLRVDEAAAHLEVDREGVLAALSILQRAMGSLAAGAGDQIQGGIEGGEGGDGRGDRIRFFSPGAFVRPPRLLAGEVLALTVGMRILAGQADSSRRRELMGLARRLEGELATPRAREQMSGEGDRFALDAADGPGDDIRVLLLDACRRTLPVRIRYLKPRGEDPEDRVVEPHHLVHAEGNWYLVAWCRSAAGGRAFRLDRILEVEGTPSPLEGPHALDPGEFVDLAGGRVYRADGHETVKVCYSPVVARWIRERGPVEELPDGGCRVEHRVSDPWWVVRHVLQYGPHAWVESPPGIRDLVQESVLRMVAGSRPGAETGGGEGEELP